MLLHVNHQHALVSKPRVNTVGAFSIYLQAMCNLEFFFFNTGQQARWIVAVLCA
jgi:hypothetical protein